MPPRRSRRIVGSVVRTTTKLVEETVEVVVVERESKDLTQEPQTAETTAAGCSSGGEEFQRSIPVEDKTPPPERPRTMPMSEDLESTKRADSTSQITNDTDATPKIETEVGDGELAGREGMKSRKKKEKMKNQGKRRQISKSSRGGGGREGYKRYVFRVLKQVHPEMGITGRAMVILNNLMNDMFERLAEEATKLSKYTGGMTLSSREIQGAVRLVLPGELGKHAIAEGTKAVSSYVSYDHTKTPQP